MKTAIGYGWIFAFMAINLIPAVQADQVGTPETQPEIDGRADGYRPLFNGKNFDGWTRILRNGNEEMIDQVFTIADDGSLHFYRDLPEGYGSTNDINGAHGVMATEKSYSRFSVTFEYKWGKKLVNNYTSYQYDAGFFYHIKELKVWPTAMQYQIRYNHLTHKNHSGDLLGPFLRTWYSADGKTFKLPGEGGIAQPRQKGKMLFALADAPFHGLDGEWNRCELIVMGGEYVIYKLNGTVVNYITDLSADSGPVGLEAETGEMFWRNIMIKEFDQSIPAENFLP